MRSTLVTTVRRKAKRPLNSRILFIGLLLTIGILITILLSNSSIASESNCPDCPESYSAVIASDNLTLSANAATDTKIKETKNKLKKVTLAEKKAAAKRFKETLEAAQIAGVTIAAPTLNPGEIPHYFGPYPNYANSPMPMGNISSITIDIAGSGYTAPVVNITDVYYTGSGAIATATIGLNGNVSSIIVTNGGSNYSAPIVTITDPTGTGATATAILGGPFSGGIRKFVDTLPGLGPAGVNNLGQYIPVAVPDATTYPGSEYYEIALVDYTEQMHSDLPPTTVRGYVQLSTSVVPGSHIPLMNPDGTPILNASGGQAYAVDNPHYMGPAISAQRDTAVRIKFSNLLPTGSGGDLFIPVDTTVMGSGPFTIDDPANPGSLLSGNFTENRATVHLHGLFAPWISDGTPHQWITPAGENTDYPKGVSVQNVPDMWYDANGDQVPAGTLGATNDPGNGSMTLYYNNQQSARLQFYHDHAYGITRLNVYVGEAAAYLVTDSVDQDLIMGTNVTGVNPTLAKILPDIGIPLVIQDRTFVDNKTIAAQDPTWNWGSGPRDPITGNILSANTGDIWMPHVYMPVQNPGDSSGINAFGRWQYAAWFWPPPGNLAQGPIPNPYYDCYPGGPCTMPWEPEQIPGTPHPSMAMEAFMDIPIVNGAVYPTLTVEPKAYRFRILNAANDRFINLQFYQADPAIITADGRTNTEVKMVPAVLTAGFPADWPIDGRDGGVPDPATAGPSFIQIGNEGGFLPAPVVLPNLPVNWNTDPTTFDAGNVNQQTLLIGTAERADVIVDFSEYAGQTLILYNDAPAAFPALDPHYDYYTGNPDLTDTGGTPTTQPGYGPNTRTIMQITVSGPAAAPYDLAALNAVFAKTPGKRGVFEVSQDQVLVPQAEYNSAYDASFPADAFVRIHDRYMTFFNGPLSDLNLTRGGSGYTSIPTVTISGGGGSGATGNATLGAAAVASFIVDNGGNSYTSAPTVTLSGGGGSGATATAALAPTAVASVVVTDAGKGYSTAPAVSFLGGGGTGAIGIAILQGKRVKEVQVTNGGSGYTSAPTVSLSGGGGSGAAATSALAPTTVASVSINNGGSGYTSAPVVGFSGGGGSGAIATATLGPAAVGSLTLTNGGSNYTSTPTVTISGGGGTGATAGAIGITIELQRKAIQDEQSETYDEYGRMSAKLGLQTPLNVPGGMNLVLYGYASPPVEIIKSSVYGTPIGSLGDGTQIWKITHNGVDTHTVHFHLYNVQVINRVAWDGAILTPDPGELGWKETVRVNPLQDTIVAMRPVAPTQPFQVPNSVRPIDVTMPLGTILSSVTNPVFDPTGEPVILVNRMVNFGWEYVLHCHLLGHEEMDMMHSVAFAVTPEAPSGLLAALVGNGKNQAVTLNWMDNSASETSFIIQRATSTGGPWTNVTVPSTTGPESGIIVTYNDMAIAKKTTYYYRVIANNVVGDTTIYAAPSIGFPTISATSAPSDISLSVTTK